VSLLYVSNAVLVQLSYLYGRGVVERLRGRKIEVEYNASGRIRRVYVDGRLAFVLRNNDGYLLPTLYGATFIDRYVVVGGEAAQYVQDGRNVPAKYITATSQDLRANGEVAVRDPSGRIIAVGRMVYSVREISLGRGYAVKVRESAKGLKEPPQ